MALFFGAFFMYTTSFLTNIQIEIIKIRQAISCFQSVPNRVEIKEYQELIIKLHCLIWLKMRFAR